MAINYPSSLDNFTNPTSASPINSPSHADQHSNANDAIEALEYKVGADNSIVTTSHDYKIAQLESLVTSAVAGAKSIYQDIRNQSGSNFVKATPVYVSGSLGSSGKILISAASNASESTSSKTMGLTSSSIANNNNGQIISEGILEGIDTTGAADGDPVWLGVDGVKIYGLANKPSAPAHLVFLGIVIRGGQANTGSMYVKIQNGFELEELHNVQISSLLNGNILAYDSSTSTWKNTNTLQSTSSTVPLIIKGSTSQTANLQEWQNNSGTTLARVNQFGDFYITGGRIFRGNQDLGANLNILNESDLKGIVVKAVSGQTKNLTELQSSTGAVLSGINPIGQLFIQTTTPITTLAGSQSITNVSFNSTTATYTFSATEQTISIGEYVTIYGITPSGYNGTYQVTAINTVTAGSSYSFTVANTTNATVTVGTGYFSPSASVSISTQNKAHTGLIIKAVSGQTASTMEIQNSLGQVTTWWDATGGMTATQTVVSTLYSGGFMNTGTLGYFNATTFSPSVRPIVVRGAASQSANLTEWQNSAGGILVSIDSNGIFNALNAGSGVSSYSSILIGGRWIRNEARSGLTRFGVSTGEWHMATNPDNSAIAITDSQVGVFATSTTLPLFTVKGMASQTANLQEWQNSSGTILAYIDKDGQILTPRVNLPANGLIVEGGTGPYIQMGSSATYLYTRSASNKGLVIQGSISQTANLQEWQDPYGGVKASFDNNGRYNLNAVYGSNFYGRLNVAGSSSDAYALDVGTINGNTPGVAQRISLNNNSDIGLIITGYASYQHTGDLLRIDGTKGNGGGDFFRVNASGAVQAYSSTQKGLTVKGYASQTANLQEWQNSAGTVLAKVDATGNAQFAGFNIQNSATINGTIYTQAIGSTSDYAGNAISINSGKAVVMTPAAASVGLVIKGAASQTADLQQWQDSSGTVLAGIGPNGRIYAQGKTGNTDDLLYLRRADNNIYMYVDKDATLRGNFGIRINQEPPIDTQAFMWSGTASRSALGVSGTGSTNPTFYAKATASQTSNLTEWQDSSGTALSYIKPDGSLNFIANSNAVLISGTSTSGLNRIISNGNDLFFSPYFDGLFAPANSAGRWRPANDATSDLGASGQRWKDLYATSVILTNNSISKVGLIVKAIASQTANLQEWQNSSGTVLTKIDSAGRITISPDSTGSNLLAANGSTTTFSVNQFGSINVIGTATSSFGSLFTGTQVGINGSSSIGLIIKGGTSADMQQWQNVGGTVVAKIDKDGNITAADLTLSGNLTVNGTTTNLNSTNLVIEDKNIIIADVATPTDTTADGAGITIKGATDKTFNWVQSTGRFTSSEPIQSSAFVSTYVYASQVGSTVIGSATLNTNSDTGGLLINTAGAANKGLSIKGAASQTADLQQWQNSSSVAVAQISATGSITTRPVGFSGNLSTPIISVTDRASTWTAGNFAFRSDSNGIPRFSFTAPNAYSEALTINGNSVGVQTPSPTSVFQVTSNGAGNTVSIIKGAVSQTANLQEWQNSAGYAGTAIDSSGSFYAPGIYSSYLMQATAGGAAVVPFTVKGVTSQTANLTEWKDSSGTVQAYIGANGFINTNNSIRIAGDNLSVYRFQGVSDGNYTMNFPGSGNIQLFSATDSLGGGSKVLGISNATTVPSSNPTGGGILYVNSGSLVYRGAGGAITTIARSGNESSTISVNTATTVDTVALSSFTTIEYTISIKQGSKVRSSKVLVHTDGTSIDSTEYGIMEMGGGITGILVTASVSSTNSILQVTITDASTTNATVKIIKTML